MSVQKIKHIMLRIKGAPHDSPIAVFRKYDSGGGLDCVFANTVDTLKRVEQEDPLLIGVFSCLNSMGQVRSILEVAESQVDNLLKSLEVSQ